MKRLYITTQAAAAAIDNQQQRHNSRFKNRPLKLNTAPMKEDNNTDKETAAQVERLKIQALAAKIVATYSSRCKVLTAYQLGKSSGYSVKQSRAAYKVACNIWEQ